MCDHLHVLHQIFLLFDFLLVGLDGCLPSKLHLDFPALLRLHLLIPILLLLLLLPAFVLAFITHVDLQVLHTPLLFLDLLIELLLLTQNGSNVELDIHFRIFRHGFCSYLFLQLFCLKFLNLLFNFWQVCWPFRCLELELLLLFVLVVVLLYIILDLLTSLLFLLLDCSQVFIGFGDRIRLESHFYFLQLWHQFRFRFSEIELLDHSSSFLVFTFLNILLCISHTSLKFLSSGVLGHFPNQLFTLLLPLGQFRQQFILQIVQLQRFLPLRENIDLQLLKIENKGKEYVHFDRILTKNNLLEFIERQLIHAETNQIVENCKQSTIILSISTTGKLRKDCIVSTLKKSAITFSSIEYLLHEDALSVLALNRRKELLCVGIRRHYLLVECVDQLYALLDQLRILHYLM